MSTINQSKKPPVFIDARGPRYTAALTTFVLAAARHCEQNVVENCRIVTRLP